MKYLSKQFKKLNKKYKNQNNQNQNQGTKKYNRLKQNKKNKKRKSPAKKEINLDKERFYHCEIWLMTPKQLQIVEHRMWLDSGCGEGGIEESSQLSH